MKTIEKYLTERKATSHDYEIKDTAAALTGEIETTVEKIVKDWMDHDEFIFNDGEEFSMSNIYKCLNLAIKKINIKKIY